MHRLYHGAFGGPGPLHMKKHFRRVVTQTPPSADTGAAPQSSTSYVDHLSRPTSVADARTAIAPTAPGTDPSHTCPRSFELANAHASAMCRMRPIPKSPR